MKLELKSIGLLGVMLLFIINLPAQDVYEFWAYEDSDWSNDNNWDYSPEGGGMSNQSPDANIGSNTEVYIWDNVDYDLTDMLVVNGLIELTGGDISSSTTANLRLNSGSSIDFSSSNSLSMGRLYFIGGSINIPSGASMQFTSSESNSLRSNLTVNGSITFTGSVIANRNSSISVGSFATLDCNSGLTNSGSIINTGTFSISGNFTNTGTLNSSNSGALISIDGTSLQSISGLAAYKIEIDNTNNVSLTGDLTVLAGGSLTIKNGDLTTGQYKVILNAGATIIGETKDHYVKGQLRIYENMVTGNTYDFGGSGVSITLSNGNTNAGDVVLDRFTGMHTASESNLGLARYITISASETDFNSAQIELEYYDAEIPDDISDESQMQAFITKASKNNETDGNATWVEEDEVADAVNNTLTFLSIDATQFDDYSFTGGGHQQALPVDFIYFNAQWLKESETAVLDWQTATEENNSHFEIQRSLSGAEWSWEQIGRVLGQGSTFDITDYQYIDNSLGSKVESLKSRGLWTPNESGQASDLGQQTVYYRLKQVDYNGDFDFSEIRTLHLQPSTLNSFELWPNPANGHIINLSVTNNYTLITADGIIIKTVTETNRIEITDLPMGIYMVKSSNGNTQSFIKT